MRVSHFFGVAIFLLITEPLFGEVQIQIAKRSLFITKFIKIYQTMREIGNALLTDCRGVQSRNLSCLTSKKTESPTASIAHEKTEYQSLSSTGRRKKTPMLAVALTFVW